MAAVVAAQVRALLHEDPGLAVVAPAGHPLADSEGAAGRVVTAPPTIRAAVAAGLCATGRAVASVWEPGEDARPLGDGAHIVVVADAVTATAVWATGAPVVHPCWPADVTRLLRTARAVGQPVVVHAPDTPSHGNRTPTDLPSSPSPPQPLPPLQGGQLRWLRGASELGAVLACGAPAARALAAATELARQGVHLGVVEAPWQPGGVGRTPLEAATSVVMLDPVEAGAMHEGRLAPEHAVGRTVADGDVDHLASGLVRALDARARGLPERR